ncbi:hypothetical protein KM295_09345 [Natronomonas sp. F2-12]|jgi:DNA repair exonuclease SbcCD ATPase subunit|uniref:Uncharacterized protein n=1 Tax=Natronomonas aquatica TaxID=2841590 RepID=A0A9R1CTG0_9EURY|nr:hypothetical protein [Natronomonas aquatica]MCQ4333677.1 hypothetical protein [Natronomonas aquatica]
MTNDTPTDDRAGVDSASFEEWLEQAAESKGVPKQELMNQMLSSYWILDELTGLVGEAELQSGIDRQSKGPADPQSGSETGVQARDTGGNNQNIPTQSPDSAPTEGSDGTSTEESIHEIQSAIQQLLEAQSAEEESPGTAPTLDGGVVSVVSELQRQVGSFESKIDDIEDRQSSQFDRLSNEFQLLIDRVDELERQRDRFVERTELEPLSDDIRDLNDRLDDLRAENEDLRAANEDLESRVDREFDNIEDLFRRLLNAIDDLDAELDTATESVRDDLEPIERREAERKQLADLKTQALSREIRRGSCESCGQRIDLALLESPECPNCTARFVGVRDGGWNPFRSPTIEAERPPIDGS